MTRTRKIAVQVVGWSLLGGCLGVAVFAGLRLFAMAALLAGVPLALHPFDDYQRSYYFTVGGRRIWQLDAACAQADSALVYSPRSGTCRFANPEFDTTLSFDGAGRAVPARSAAGAVQGIAILGDSHAMGWGVNDADTFANVLQRSTTQPVYNLAVSSYGTERELKRLVLSGLLEQVDTIVIQYCDNDLGEYPQDFTPDDHLQFAALQATASTPPTLPDRARIAWRGFKLLLATPPLWPWDEPAAPVPESFVAHEAYLRETLQRYEPYIAGKRVVVFYSNAHGLKFSAFPAGQDARLRYLTWFDPPLGRQDYFAIDDHLTVGGHQRLGEALATFLQQR